MGAMTLIWTALPAGIRRSGDGEWLARVSVFLSPRLEVTGDSLPLSAFAQFVDWPKTLSELGTDGITFLVQMHDGGGVVASVTAGPTSTTDVDVAPDSQAWRSIFGEAATVAPYVAPEDAGRQGFKVESYDAQAVAREIRNVYAQALLRELDVDAAAPTLAAFNIPAARLEAPPAAGEGPIEKFIRFHRFTGDAQPPEKGNEPESCPGFHEIVAGTGTHPRLMRRLGLVHDLEVPANQLGLDVAGRSLRIRVEPSNLAFEDTTQQSLWTMVEYDTATSDRYRVFRAAGDQRLGSGGLYALGNSQTTIVQEQLEHATFALIQRANLSAQSDSDDATSQLPALLQGGMRLTSADKRSVMQNAMRDQFRLEQSLQIARARLLSGVPAVEHEEEILRAEHVTRGYRVDVQDIESGEWRSLCRRAVSYEAGDWSWPAAQTMLEDEGVIEPTAFTDQNHLTPRTGEDLFEWDGWSLVVPRPERADNAGAKPTATCGTLLSARLAVPAGSLEPQRFGRYYRFRLRDVDLAGNSLSVKEADVLAPGLAEDALVTAPVCCLRVESVKPPVVFRAQPRGPGEAGDVIVLRDADSPKYRTDEFSLHVVPPEVPLRIAEKHGVFDGMSTADSWRMISRHRGDMDRDEKGEPREAIAAREFFTPYLPDPIVRQAVLSLPDGGGTIDMPRFDDLPSSARGRELARSCRLVVRPGKDRVEVRAAGREVVLKVPRGRVQTIHLAAKLGAADVSVLAFAHPDWRGNVAPPSDEFRTELAAAASHGEAPLLAPARPVTIVYATQRPLMAPAFGRPLILTREADSTSAVLADDALKFDRPSTGRIDVYARWEDPVDDPADDGWRTSASELYAGGVRIGGEDGKPLDPLEMAESPRSPLAHDFGDTRHRKVAYRAQATSRFVEFYPASLTEDADSVTLWSEPVMLNVPCTAPPTAPDIAYVIPTFGVGESGSTTGSREGEQRAERFGDGLRVYMNRGWFSSGAGEKLALVVATAPDLPEELWGRVSEWGTNPLRDSAPLPGPLRMEHVWGGAARLSGWPLDGGTVGLVVHEVQFSDVHRLPFVDIEFLAQRAFMPLVRLALARYQEDAIKGCHLSPIVHADFVPLAPGRAVTIRQVADATWSLAMRGYSYADDGLSNGGTSVVIAHIEYMPQELPEDLAGWRPLGDAVHLQAESPEPWRFHWQGILRIDDPQYLSSIYRRRIVVREFEPFISAGTAAFPLEDRSRLVSAHALAI